MIDKELYTDAIIRDYRLFRCPKTGEMLKINNNVLISEKSKHSFSIYEGIPDFARLTIQNNIKEEVQRYWNNCPNEYIKSIADIGSPEYYYETEKDRFNIHLNFNKPFLKDVIGFNKIKGKKLLEIGCGIGLDAIQFARSGNDIYLMDLSLNSV